MKESFIDFKKRITRDHIRKHKVTNSWGTYDYYKYYRRSKPAGKKYVLTESQFYAIIRKVNQEIVDHLLTYSSVPLPFKFGELIIQKFDKTPRINERGELVHNTCIDWGETLRLWYEDDEAFREKTLVYMTTTSQYKVLFYKAKAMFPYQGFYEFKLNSTARQILSKKIKNGEIDGFMDKKNRIV